MIRKQMEHDLWSFETSHKIAETRDRMIKKEMCERAAAQGETSGQCKLLEQLIEEKYAIEVNHWLHSLTHAQLITSSILKCDSFEELKQVIDIASTD